MNENICRKEFCRANLSDALNDTAEWLISTAGYFSTAKKEKIYRDYDFFYLDMIVSYNQETSDYMVTVYYSMPPADFVIT